jgi:hypothetical protein
MTELSTPLPVTAPPMRAFWIAGFCVYLALVSTIVVAAYLGRLPDVPFLTRVDYLGHAVLIGLLAFFLDGALGFRPVLASRGRPLGWLRLAPVIVLMVAGAEELAQSLSPFRSCSLTDFAGDVVGIFALSALALRIDRRWRRSGGGRGGRSRDGARPVGDGAAGRGRRDHAQNIS